MNVKQQRFSGWQLENAQFLTNSYDLILVVGVLSALAEKRNTLKEGYLLAKESSENAQRLHFNFKTQADHLRVKLSSKLSKANYQYLNQLNALSDETFDQVYAQSMKTKLRELDMQMVAYKATGKSDRLVELADDVQDCFRPLNERLTQRSLISLIRPHKPQGSLTLTE